MNKIILRREQFLQSFKNFFRRVFFDGGTLEAPVYVNNLLKSIQNASILQIPVTFGLGKLYNQIGEDFDVVRNSDVWRINESGILENIGVNVPCIDYTDGFPVILRQPQSTNFIKNSSTLSLLSVNNAALMTDNAAISPENIQNAAIYETDGLINSYVRSAISFTSTSATQLLTYSYHVKYIDNQWLRLRTLGISGQSIQVWFDILNGVIGTDTSTIPVTPKIKALKNGWFRISVTAELDLSVDNTDIFQFYIVNEDGLNDQTAGKKIALYVPQAEELGYASTPIKTGANVVTRLADEITGAGSTSTINSEEGVLYVERKNMQNINGNYITLNDGSVNNRITYYISDTAIIVQIWIAGVNQGTALYNTDISEFTKACVVYDSTSYRLFINESPTPVATKPLNTTIPPNTLDRLDLGTGGSNTKGADRIKELRVYKSIAEAQIDLPYIS
tara:strand:- start:58 stop:1401 length:1344 start_codon:yes stop_codon:yes gene_type:complete